MKAIKNIKTEEKPEKMPGLVDIKTIDDEDEVECFSEDSDVEEEVRFV